MEYFGTNSETLTWSLALFVLLILSAFFSCCETGMLSINRYRLKHLVNISEAAKRVQKLLERPDRLLSVILLVNTFINILISAIGTLLAIHLLGEKMGMIVSSIVLTLLILVFAEVAPKTLAALYPEKVAFPVSRFLMLLMKLLYPLVWILNSVALGLLRLFGVSLTKHESEGMSREELRTIVHETTGRIPSKHRFMLLSILDLEEITVDDLMIPRVEVMGIDLNNNWDAIFSQIANTQHTFLPVYQQNLNNIIGVVHAKKMLHLISQSDFNEQKLRASLDEPLFVPQGTTLTKQMVNFQKSKERFALVVDEYGDIVGLITLEDILEEIVGEFTTNMSEAYTAILVQDDGSYLVDGATTIRECNRFIEWKLPTDGPKTINGLVIHHLQMIPETGTCCLINNIPIEVVQVQDNRIKSVKVFPPIER